MATNPDTTGPNATVKTLLKQSLRDTAPAGAADYLDLPGPEFDHGGVAQRAMRSPLVSRVYENFWRPIWGRLLKGPFGPSMQDEYRLAVEMLAIEPGDRVLDVACGPGNFTRHFARSAAPSGIAVGLDGSRAMLDRAVAETAGTANGAPGNVVYVRGDALDLPFDDQVFDGVCCFAALHMFPDPFAGLAEMTRVLKPSGRIALLTSTERGTGPVRVIGNAFGKLSDQRIFGRHEIIEELDRLGYVEISQRMAGMAQLVGAGRSGH